MIIGFQGPMGSGKTLGACIWAWRYALLAGGAPVMANLALRPEYFARHAQRNPGFHVRLLQSEEDFVELARAGGGWVIFDEIHQNLDSRTYAGRQQIYFTQFLMYLRKLRMPLILTSQSIAHQVDVRVRANLDVLVDCHKTRWGFRYDVFDARSGVYQGSRRVPWRTATQFYGIYDTYQLIRPVEFPTTERQYVQFLEALEDAQAEQMPRRRRPVPPAFWPADMQPPPERGAAGA
ncbi:MAG: hypothetical protein IRZ18_08395 [Clostridia bacterium]|nr:hypothetical protein [Clostridia bacterium]